MATFKIFKILKSVVLALATSLLFSASVLGADANQIASLQPFKAFSPGTGEGYAYEYKNRTKVEFVAMLRDPVVARTEMRVTCEVLVQQIMEVHQGLSFEGCEGAARAIETDPAFEVMSCDSEMFQNRNSIVVTNQSGNEFGTWHRDCYAGEQVLTYKGVELISLTCLNPIVPLPRAVVTSVPTIEWRTATPGPVVSNHACPMITEIVIYDYRAANLEGVKQLLASYPTDGDGSEDWRISRFYGALFNEELNKGSIGLSTRSHDLFVVLVREGEEVVLFDGPVTKYQRVHIPDEYGFTNGDKIITRFRDHEEIISPSWNGLHSWYEEFGVCNTNTQSIIARIER